MIEGFSLGFSLGFAHGFSLGFALGFAHGFARFPPTKMPVNVCVETGVGIPAVNQGVSFPPPPPTPPSLCSVSAQPILASLVC